MKQLTTKLQKLKIKMKTCVCRRCGREVVARKLRRHQTSFRCTVIFALGNPSVSFGNSTSETTT